MNRTTLTGLISLTVTSVAIFLVVVIYIEPPVCHCPPNNNNRNETHPAIPSIPTSQSKPDCVSLSFTYSLCGRNLLKRGGAYCYAYPIDIAALCDTYHSCVVRHSVLCDPVIHPTDTGLLKIFGHQDEIDHIFTVATDNNGNITGLTTWVNGTECVLNQDESSTLFWHLCPRG